MALCTDWQGPAWCLIFRQLERQRADQTLKQLSTTCRFLFERYVDYVAYQAERLVADENLMPVLHEIVRRESMHVGTTTIILPTTQLTIYSFHHLATLHAFWLQGLRFSLLQVLSLGYYDQSFSFSFTAIEESTPYFTSGLFHCGSLLSLNIRAQRLDAPLLSAVSLLLAPNQQLRALSLSACDSLLEEDSFSSSSSSSLSPLFMETLAMLGGSLQHLTLHCGRMSGRALDLLAQPLSKLTLLHSLDLSNNALSDAAAAVFCTRILPCLPHLRVLRFCYNNVGRLVWQALEHACESPIFLKLELLDLSYNNNGRHYPYHRNDILDTTRHSALQQIPQLLLTSSCYYQPE